MKPKLVIIGAAGRMGKIIASLAIDADELTIAAAVDTAGHPDLGKDIGTLAGNKSIGVNLSASLPDHAAVVIDFSLPDGAQKTVDFCLNKNAALVMGTTGLDAAAADKIKQAAKKIPVIYGTNMSVGMNVLFALVGKAAQMLGPDYDIEIIEQHHRFKKDAPSGSALTLAEKICKDTNRDYPDSLNYGRFGKDALRKSGEIGIHAVRAGDITGIHSVIYSTLGESVTLNHTAHNRDGFAKGALRAAAWLVGKNPGQYTVADCLGIK